MTDSIETRTGLPLDYHSTDGDTTYYTYESDNHCRVYSKTKNQKPQLIAKVGSSEELDDVINQAVKGC